MTVGAGRIAMVPDPNNLPSLADTLASVNARIRNLQETGKQVIGGIGDYLRDTFGVDILNRGGDQGPEAFPSNTRDGGSGGIGGALDDLGKIADEGIDANVTLGPSVFVGLALLGAIIALR